MTTPMKKFNLTVDGVAYAIEILGEENGHLDLRVNGNLHRVEIDKILGGVPTASSTVLAAGDTPITQSSALSNGLTAPMPGDIIEVLVKPGDRVQAGDAICVLEAMKMKNTLRAAQAGAVSEVRVAPGQSVKHGELLVVFEERP